MTISAMTVNSLPVELLAHIFTLAAHGEVVDNSCHRYSVQQSYFNTRSVKMPVLLSCISRYWRHVAINTPALWTSLCLTQEMVMECFVSGYRQSCLDTTFLELYLARSRMYPLDILIDARDPSWDYSEPEMPFGCGPDGYSPAFSSCHIVQTLQLLLPHLHRWRSLAILTDIWAPMYTALECINPFLTCHGAPRLESLSLSRCNPYASHCPEFYPASMKNPSLFSLNDASPPNDRLGLLLPSLRHLKLQGVHVDWPVLGQILSQRPSDVSLASLELDYHSRDVRPSLEDFHQILASSSQLETLAISGSGPLVADVDDDATLIHHNLHPVSLFGLRDLTLGYRSVAECHTILELLHAPNTVTLSLEDATDAADPEDVEAGTILTYLGSGGFNELEYKTSAILTRPQPVFPALTTLSLSSVKTQKRPLNAFLNSLQHLRELETSSMDLEEVIPSLVPSSLNTPNNTIICPCPRLEKLTFRGIDVERAPECQSVVGFVDRTRQSGGALPLKQLDVQVVEFGDAEEDDDIEMGDDGGDEEEAAFHPGGVFNDPEFDRYYTMAALQYR